MKYVVPMDYLKYKQRNVLFGQNVTIKTKSIQNNVLLNNVYCVLMFRVNRLFAPV